jgi:hypothetical protein
MVLRRKAKQEARIEVVKNLLAAKRFAIEKIANFRCYGKVCSGCK